MFIRRLLALLCSLFLVFCVVWPGAYAVEVPDLDDLDIDPWGDLGLIQETPEPTPTAPIGEPALQDPVELEPAGEGDTFFSARAANSADTYSPTYAQFSYVSSASGKFNGVSMSSANTYDLYKSLSLSSAVGTLSYSYTANVSQMSFNIPVSYSADNYSKLNLSLSFPRPSIDFISGSFKGVGSGGVCNLSGNNTALAFTQAQLLVNGQPYGDKFNVTGSAGAINTKSISVELGKDISVVTSLGIRFFASFSANYSGNLYTTFLYGYSSYTAQGQFFFINRVSNTQYSIIVDGVSPGPGMDEETKGLLGTIIAWLTSIRDTIGSVFTAIIELPGRIATALIEGIKSLFIPDEEDLTGLKDQYAQLLEERLGFVWQAGEMVVSFGQSVLSAFETATDFQFEFPGVSFELPELGQVTLIEPQVVSVDNAFMDVMQPVLGTIVSFICVLAFINTAERMVVAVASGVSYFHFLKGD